MNHKIFLFLIIIISACSNQNKKDIYSPSVIKIDSICQKIDIDKLIEDFRYIELGCDNGYVISEIKQLIICDDRIYVLSDGVYCYDMDGNPLFKINSKGHSKSEFIDCTSISVDDGILYLYDKHTRIIHKYNANDGSFIDNTTSPICGRSIFKIPNVYVIDKLFKSDFYEGDARIITTSDFEKVKETYLQEEQYQIPIQNQVTYCNCSVIYTDYESNSLYVINQDGLSEYWITCKEAVPLSKELFEQYKNSNQPISDKYIYGLTNVYENNNHIVGQFKFGNYFSFVYDKNSDKVIAFKEIVSEVYCIGLNNPFGVYNDYFIGIISADDYDFQKEVFGFGKPLPNNHPYHKNQNVLLEHDNNDNPIVVLYKYRELK